MKKRCVWVVEMWAARTKYGPEVWGPTVGSALTRDDGRVVMADWKARNPTDRFRIVRYVPEGEK